MSRSREYGFSLTELAIVLVIVGLLFVLTLPLSSTMVSNERRNVTTKTLDNIQAALVAYVATNKRLPCPADGALPAANAAAGAEGARDAGGYCISQDNGVVPWKPLGLTMADTMDAWFNRITYRVAYSLTSNGSLDMSACDPAGTKISNPAPPALPASSVGLCDSVTCTGLFSVANCTSPRNFLTQKGISVSDGASVVMDYANGTGAAYVLISHGENGYGAFSSDGSYQATSSKGIAGVVFENPNRNIPVDLSVGANAPPVIVDAPRQDSTNDPNVYFDDIVVRPSILMLVNKAQLGPRSH